MKKDMDLKKRFFFIGLSAALLFMNGCLQTMATRPDKPTPAVTATEKAKAETDITSASAAQPVSGAASGTLPSDRTDPVDTDDRDGAEKEASCPPESSKTSQSLLDDALEFCQLSQEYWQKGELENALEALDQAYQLILKVEPYDIPKLIQQKEDLRFLISKRILEIYASRHIVVNGDHDAIPIEINQHVKAEIDKFTGPERSFFMNAYKRAGRYRERILKAVKAAGLPEELAWLPLIESGFKVKALSPARALGLWQFIPSTGYKFGLKRNLYVDERLDPEKATAAAIAYLKELHQIFGDWSTVLAAYNCGEGKVLRVIRSQNVNYLDNFWDLYERLPLETARYVPRFLATIHILNNMEKYGMVDLEMDQPLVYDTVSLEKRVLLKDVAAYLKVEESQLRELNPELRYNLLPPEPYELNVPLGKGEILLAALDDIPESAAPTSAYVYHRVRSGETLSTIARRYGASVRSICLANNIYRRNLIIAGQKLKIPQKGTKVYPLTSKKKSVIKGTVSHRVKRGENLWILAKRYHTTTKDIQDFNGLRSTRLSINQVLKIPVSESVAKTAPSKGFKPYVVQRGDSPYEIARRYSIPLHRFLDINQLSKASKIYPGQTLLIE